MHTAPRVLVAGTGFAGKGHAAAFRAAGAEVVGLVGRTDHVVRDVARDLEIPFAGTDWTAALAELTPDIVAIGTPGGAHAAQVTPALEAGCHVFCDKPLTTDGPSAAALLALAEAKGVKTAFAASFQFMPAIQQARRMIAAGAIGAPTEIECVSHFHLDRHIPFGWSHRAADGGGRLNNNFTHSLAIALTLTDGTLLQVAGDVRDDLGRAPIVEGVHDFTERRQFIPKDPTDPALDWGESDVEWSYTVMARLGSPLAAQPVSALFKHGGLVPRFQDDHVVIYGREGAIFLNGHYGSGPLHLHTKAGWVAPAPEAVLPAGMSETAYCWNVLADLFVRDIQGEPVPAYPTFREGCLFQQVIDAIRRSDRWVDIATEMQGGTP